MRGYCAKCGRTVEGQMLCPQCGIQVSDPLSGSLPIPYPPPDEIREGAFFLRRLALGAIMLLGLYQGLKHLGLAVLLARSSDATISADGLLGLLLVALLGSTVASGTANRLAECTGLLLALLAIGGCLGPDVARGRWPSTEWLIVVPAMLTLVGLAGGFASRLIVPPPARLPRISTPDVPDRLVIQRPVEALSWVRILLGLTLVVMGTIFADAIRNALFKALATSGKALGASDLITWQVSVLVALVGGFASGTNTVRGLRQGFVTGLLGAAIIIVATVVMGPDQSLLIDFWLRQTEQPSAGPLVFAAFGVSIWGISTVGGWLGSQLLPPRGRR